MSRDARFGVGAALALGLLAFEGVLGGIFLRTSPRLTISARDAGFIAAIVREDRYART